MSMPPNQPPNYQPPPGYTPPNAPPPGYAPGFPPVTGYPPQPGMPYYPPMQPGMPGPLFLEPPISPFAIASLICGVVGFIFFPILAPLAGIIMGHVALAQTNRQPPQYRGKGLAIAGLITSYASFLLYAAIIGLIIARVAMGAEFR